jgi:hypothetical protein
VKTKTPALPTMSRALARHLRELPSSENGLSLTEQLTLRILTEKGPMNAPRLFGWYTNHYEPLVFMGDSGYWAVLRGLANTEKPALKIEERGDMPKDGNKHWHIELLPFGEDLLRSNADWLKTNPVERWVGGVRIDSRQATNWRFDNERGVALRQ